ncbi:MAG: acetoacetate--CoA ligase [Promethearchaeota archaeon]
MAPAQPLWTPTRERVERANTTAFVKFVNEKHGLNLAGYFDLYDWSVENLADFWAAVWDFTGIVASEPYQEVVEDLGKFPGTKWFVGARLNFAENLLRHSGGRTALKFRGEAPGQESAFNPFHSLNYDQLRSWVARLAAPLKELGVGVGDRVVGYAPNFPGTPVAMLTATSLGATWASCGLELGPNAVLDRLGQIEPKVMFAADGYWYKGKPFDCTANLADVAKGLPSLRKVVVLPFLKERPDVSAVPNAVLLEEFADPSPGPRLDFVQLPFDHPLYVMFSSGTTGKPKCMVQSAGGVLVNHLKELLLSTDLKPEDVLCYLTSPSWMMWNWQTSALAVGCTVVNFNGNPSHPDWRTAWKVVQEEGVTVFGVSASYIYSLASINAEPGAEFDLSRLKEISQTASPLSADGFLWVYEHVKADLHLNSISGGTDINGCFASGDPTLPVYAGQLQGPSLGMKVAAYDDDGNPVFDQQAELVCELPAPSMPIYFWGDEDFSRYRAAYFEHFAPLGKNVWRHGDYVVFHSETRGITFFGRSDAVLKPSGVRIGTAEIYEVVEALPEVEDSLAVGITTESGETRVVLFVKVAPGHAFDDELADKIRRELRQKASPRHVPAVLLETPAIPYTFSNKKVELAVTAILNGRTVTNREALANPESLDFYKSVRDRVKV